MFERWHSIYLFIKTNLLVIWKNENELREKIKLHRLTISLQAEISISITFIFNL